MTSTEKGDRVRGMSAGMNPGLMYTAARFAIFAAVAGVLSLLGFRSWFLVLAALLVSMPLSYFALRRQRMAFAERIEERGRRRRELRAQLRGDVPDEPGR